MKIEFEDHIHTMLKWELDSRVEEKVKDTCVHKYVCNLCDISLQQQHMSHKIEYCPYDCVDVPEDRKAEIKMFYVEMVPTFSLNIIHFYCGNKFEDHLPDMDVTSLRSPMAKVNKSIYINSLEQWDMIQDSLFPVKNLDSEFALAQEEGSSTARKEEQVP